MTQANDPVEQMRKIWEPSAGHRRRRGEEMRMTTKLPRHTPGPWTAHLIGYQWEPRIHDDGTGTLLAVVGNAEETQEARLEWEANADLMAAAPDMHMACASVWAHLADTDDPRLRALADECRAALDKAAGALIAGDGGAHDGG